MSKRSLQAALGELPLIAILRGLPPKEAAEVATTLVDVGFRVVEVPLNSPRPFESIAAMVEAVGDRAVVGAGTVLSADDAHRVAAAGATLVIAPNTDLTVARACAESELDWVPGVFTPSEAFSAVQGGARALKLFPAGAASPAFLTALQAVLPGAVPILAVGGIAADDLSSWWQAGARGFGIGGALYRPGRTVEELRQRAQSLLAAARELESGQHAP
ncbi:MAG: 2-dehydro-3-deoxy-6-phosphogalactonate aldolase [Rickettsiales bacterium]|nr:2-dehydro-3-deoxy-6-phosphogalactonate aldolase [Rickettsiales bacterium]